MHLRAGTSGFAYREWRGKFYPADLPPKGMLSFYAARFPAVEINATFYRMPTVRTLEGWSAEVPPEFRFAFKAPALITHRRRLRGAGADTAEFLNRLSVLGGRLGPVLFQLPPNLPVDIPLLGEFLSSLPDMKTAFEFRHPSWLVEDVFDLLRRKGAALCISDRDDAPDPPVVATAEVGYLRLRRSGYTEEELQKWRETIAGQPWEEAFVFFRHEETAAGPRLAAELERAFETSRHRGRK
ncbi:MAG TPA: DUF72 domain-containing protein [Verrucomicrobiae bacterium]|nr:DUF72 domain-containing protein [Verrucomicrobiae bacterium]